MFKRITFAISGVLILALAVLSTNAHSIPFKGDIWVAHHIDTQDYFLLFDTEMDIQPETVKLNGPKLKTSNQPIDFEEVTKSKEPLFFEIVDYKIGKKIEANFRDIEGNKYKVEAKFKEFHNPPGGGNLPIPEPATILLIGLGLIGLAGFRRKKFLKK